MRPDDSGDGRRELVEVREGLETMEDDVDTVQV